MSAAEAHEEQSISEVLLFTSVFSLKPLSLELLLHFLSPGEIYRDVISLLD